LLDLDKYIRPEVQEYINQNTGENLDRIAFKKSPFADISQKELLDQIEGKKKCKKKLSLWYNTEDIIYPSKISVEQTSSQASAVFKANLFKKIASSNKSNGIDLSGGFGVDTFFISRNFKHYIHCELDEELSAIAKHNFKKLGANNIECFNGDSIEFLNEYKGQLDLVYIDPARRSQGKKVFQFKDSIPNPIQYRELLLKKSKILVIKASPLLDISQSLKQFPELNRVYIISVNREVKELLLISDKKFDSQLGINCLELSQNGEIEFQKEFNPNLTNVNHFEQQDPKKHNFLYDAYPSIMKAGVFNQIGEIYKVDKIALNTHLYTSEKFIEEFPGRSFKIIEKLGFGDREFKKRYSKSTANLTVKNFNLKTEQIRKKYKISDGGDKHIFIFRNVDNKALAYICERIYF
jgi:16S rRNA G966 N2-methylase RsmD